MATYFLILVNGTNLPSTKYFGSYEVWCSVLCQFFRFSGWNISWFQLLIERKHQNIAFQFSENSNFLWIGFCYNH